MPHLLEDWPSISQRFRAADRVLLFFDYDGTLTPIVPRPDLAALSTEVRQLLEALAGNPKYVVGVVSGRSLADVRERVGLPEIIYSGNHGMEIDGPGIRFLHPVASELKTVLGQMYQSLSDRMAEFPGVIVEDKGVTLSVHYRLASEKVLEQVEFTFTDVLLFFQESAPVKATYGKKVLEVRPDVEWNKGQAIARVMEGHSDASLAAFFGDDVTDEDGFAVVQDACGIAVLVGPSDRATKAQYRVDSPEQVAEFLRLIARV